MDEVVRDVPEKKKPERDRCDTEPLYLAVAAVDKKT